MSLIIFRNFCILAEEKLQKAKDKWNENRMERFDFINQKLRQKHITKTYMNNVDDACVDTIEYLRNEFSSFTIRVATIRFLVSMRNTEKWLTIICYSGYRPGMIYSLQDSNAIRELHKIASITEKEVKSWQNKRFGKFIYLPIKK